MLVSPSDDGVSIGDDGRESSMSITGGHAARGFGGCNDAGRYSTRMVDSEVTRRASFGHSAYR